MSVEQSLSREDAAILDVFFRALIEDSEGGYVLFNQKPICINGVLLKKSRIVTTPGHKMSVALHQGLATWKNFADKQRNILIQSFSHPDDSQTLIILNKNIFLEIVRENLPLFRYVLGPTLTPEALLATIQAESFDFYKIVKDNKALIGVILGFGLDNSLLVSREENIHFAFEDFRETPPMQARQSLIPCLSNDCQHSLFFTNNSDPEGVVTLQPSFGFKDINDEYLTIRNSIEVASEKLLSEPAAFYFGWVKSDPKNLKLISCLETTQTKIRKLLSSSLFLSEVLRLITGREFQFQLPQNKKLSLKESEIGKVNKTLAQWIWNNIGDAEAEFFENFSLGFIELKKQQSFNERMLSIENKDTILIAKRNLDASDQFFDALRKNQALSCLIDKHLYYHEIKNGQGELLDQPYKVSITYQIFNPTGDLISEVSQLPVQMDIHETIPGFAHGLKGMRVGGVREIFIHPGLAYGIYTNQEKGIYLRAIVSLVGIHPDKTEFPKLEFCDMSFLQKPDFKKELQKDFNKMAYNWGCRVSEHLSKSEWVNKGEILSELESLRIKKIAARKLHEDEIDLINKIHWNIYFSADPKI